jgi:hypothetical protein
MMTIQLTWTTMIRRCAIAFLCAAALATTVWGADELIRIDFRNKIPGVLDAPVFHFDGVTGLDGRFVAGLAAGTNSDTLAAVDVGLVFLSGTNAGYWAYDEPQEGVLVPQPILGQRVYYQVLIGQSVPAFPFYEAVAVGASGIYSMVVTNHLMPLVGLESFRLVPERLQIRHEDDAVIVEWRYLAARKYELQTTSSLQPPVVWSPIWEWSGVGDSYQKFSVTNAVTDTPQFYRLQRWEEWP